MHNISTELMRTVVALKHGEENASNDHLEATQANEQLQIKFAGHSRSLLGVLAETFAQEETDFAANLLHHALSETLKILPTLISADEFERFEERLIPEIGMTEYLALLPVFPFEKGLKIPNFAEVCTPKGIVFGSWNYRESTIDIVDPCSKETVLTYEKSDVPEFSVDGMTLQWSGTNVKPVFIEPIVCESLVQALSKADLLYIEGAGYLYRDDPFVDELKFLAFSNTNHSSISDDENILETFKVIHTGQECSLQPLPKANTVLGKVEGGWEVGCRKINAYTMRNVIIEPAE